MQGPRSTTAPQGSPVRIHPTRRASLVPLAITVSILASLQVQGATTVVSNLAESQDFPFGVSDTGQFEAGSFKTGLSGGLLESIRIPASHIAGSFTGFTVSLAADPDSVFGGIPGVVLSTLTGSQPGAFGMYTFTDPNHTVLQPDTPYWITATVAPGSASTFTWTGTMSLSQSGLAGWDILDDFSAFSNDQGATWQTHQGSTQMLEVNLVPEPGTWAAIGMTALASGIAWRRRLARTASDGQGA